MKAKRRYWRWNGDDISEAREECEFKTNSSDINNEGHSGHLGSDTMIKILIQKQFHFISNKLLQSIIHRTKWQQILQLSTKQN